jgi:glycosyltransferase involved in cell wall biosynthesis
VKIAIVGVDFAPGRTGIETYFRNLITALQQVDRTNEYSVFVPARFIPDLVIEAPNFTPVATPDRAPLWRRALARAGPRRSRPGPVPHPKTLSMLDRGSFDVIHFPLQLINPWGVRARKVVTFVDIQHEYLPQMFSPQTLRSRKAVYRPTAEAADHIIAISEFTRQTLLERYHLRADRVTTVHLCYDGAHDRDVRATAPALPPKFFFYPASTWPHKNHVRLLEAFQLVHREHPDFALVLTGMAMQDSEGLAQLITRLGLDGAVHMLGYLPYEQLPGVYRAAYALVFPSLFEGFGIPLCEAMAAGCPVVASRTTSIPEVAGPGALYFDPEDTRSIAACMTHLIENPDERARLTAAGIERARLFSPELMARRTVAVYERLATRG